MIQSSKILWGEGLFLRPQHLQRQDAYHEWRAAQTARNLHPYAWGIRRVKVDADALSTGMLRLQELQLVFPDGELFNAPNEDELPAPLALTCIPAGVNEMTFHATLPEMRPNGTNFSAPAQQAKDAALRYTQHQETATDWFTNAAESQVAVLRRNVRVLPDNEPREHLVNIPICSIRRSTTGNFELNARFMPPSLSISSAPHLQLFLRRQLDLLQAKVEALYGSHREPSKNVIEFRSGDVASFWLLHTSSSAFAALSHYHHNPGLHPERLYERMLELAGALMTFSKGHSLSDLPAYKHTDPGPCFFKLDQIIRDLLETVISTRAFSIALHEIKPSYHHGRLDSGKITANTNFYIGIKAAMPTAELIDAVPARFKVGSPDDVEKLVLSATSGVRISHAQQVPAAIPVRPGAFYFAIEPRGPLYERMLQSQTIALYVPSGFNDLQMELFAVNP